MNQRGEPTSIKVVANFW